jgi:hypothetical protein
MEKSAAADFLTSIIHHSLFISKATSLFIKGAKEQKSPARGDFTPSKPPAGRSRFEAQEYSDLCGGRLKAPP